MYMSRGARSSRSPDAGASADPVRLSLSREGVAQMPRQEWDWLRPRGAEGKWPGSFARFRRLRLPGCVGGA
jgi:hypothetical protein